MKNVLKRITSVFLAVTIIFSSAYVGLGEVDFSKIKFNGISFSGVSQFLKALTPEFSVESHAANEGDLTFTLNDDGESYSITTCNTSAEGELVIPSTYNDLAITYIGYQAFSGCTSLTSVKIPNNVTSIGGSAFKDCIELSSITIPESVTSIGGYAFEGCSNLENVYITDLAAWCNIAFDVWGANPMSYAERFYVNGELIADVVIPSSVTSIGYKAFEECKSLTSVTIPDSVTSIADCAFRNCTNLNSAIIGNGVTSIGDGTFVGCERLTSIEIPDSVISIGESAFNGCERLTSIEIPDSVKTIGEDAFCDCESLTELKFGANVTNVAYSAFEDCWNLESIYIKDLSSWCNINFGDCESNPLYYTENFYINGELVFDVIIPAGVKRISNYTFCGFNDLETVTIPTSVTRIGVNTFAYCNNMTDVFYEGSQNQWNAISIATNNDNLTNAHIHYNVGEASWKNHYGEPVTKQEPTCAQIGLYTYICPCGYEKTEELPMLEHNYSEEWTIDSEATCEFSGSKSHHCLTCDSRTDITEIPATGVHTPSEWYIDYNATCTREGSKYRRCTYCLEILERVTIPKKEHTPSEWYTEKEATVNSAGSKYNYCTSCGQYIETAEIPQLKCSKPKLKTISNTEYGVKITWGKVSGADSYRVYRKTSKSDWKYLGSTSKTGYTDKTAKSGTKYYYAVRARNEAGNSSLSSSLSKYYLADTTLKTPSSTKSGVKLSWGKVSGADGYMVYRKTGTGSYTKIATIKGSSKVIYTDKSAKKGKTYTYKIKAYKSKTYSAYSNAKKIKDKY